ncbi:uncharacterized protein BDW43DRAFT_321482 [Aspergillus alliaceus]|uniref:uncharacterized protein n=1 Tax=Petromyces alliaceus TaxID=209559 RepID=UPI0012A77996|nr:uncharacterized protein BDW43DRAFT_321482 [Aspergillus alliaceus]KAB8230340.1 hypothetical protein BDW43DRAFT_321482 [Aspergillus alliaceus]
MVGLDTNTSADGECHAENTQPSGLPALKSILMTGGSWFVRHMIQVYGDCYDVVCLGNLDYYTSTKNLEDVEDVLHTYRIGPILHFAARSRVDTPLSVPFPSAFIEEQTFYRTNPCSARKAATEMITLACLESFRIISHARRKMPVQRDGRAVLWLIFRKGSDGETYNTSSITHLQYSQHALDR